jgi:hypothetical protein
MVGSYSLLNAISVVMELWMIEHRVFVFETFIQTDSSVVLTQRRFRIHFNVGRHGAVPSRNTILKWVKKQSPRSQSKTPTLGASQYVMQNGSIRQNWSFFFNFFNLHSGEWSPNWVYSARQPFIGLLYVPRVIVRMENLVE